MSTTKKIVGIALDDELLSLVQQHRERLDAILPEGVPLTTLGAAARNLMVEGTRAVDAREKEVGR